jgi:aryl-alcohol dehydrogenase-like predicted oxidoreductase
MYGGTKSETFIGEILGARRKEVTLATKFGGIAYMSKQGERWGAREYITACVEASLRRLQTDWIDLYQMHYPDPETPIEETLEVLNDLVKQGKVRALGCSNFTAAMIANADAKANALKAPHFATAQNEWSILKRDIEKDAIPACDKYGLGQLPYFPLANGLLTGKYKRGEGFAEGTRLAKFAFAQGMATDANFTKIEALQAYAEKRGHSLLEVAFSWLGAQPCVTSVIAGATTPEQVRANARAMNWKMSAQEVAEISALAPLNPA